MKQMLRRTPEYRRDGRAAANPIFLGQQRVPIRRRATCSKRCLARFGEFEPAIGAFVCHDIGAARAATDLATKRWRA
jgi:hypothetical protein